MLKNVPAVKIDTTTYVRKGSWQEGGKKSKIVPY